MTTWEPVKKWYDQAVGKEGHYYHKQIILPKLLSWMDTKDASVLDLACGQGILGRHLPKDVPYVGLDISPSLIQAAKSYDKSPKHHYQAQDITKKFSLKNTFSHCAVVLALQNIEAPQKVFENAHRYLQEGGTLILVLNHPCFRIPRQTSWGIDEEKKVQYRRVDRYHSDIKIPIQAHPSKGKKSATTWSFHHPLSAYTQWLFEAGFSIQWMEEWCSDKKSTGKKAKMENRSRNEFPLFLTIVAKRQ